MRIVGVIALIDFLFQDIFLGIISTSSEDKILGQSSVLETASHIFLFFDCLVLSLYIHYLNIGVQPFMHMCTFTYVNMLCM